MHQVHFLCFTLPPNFDPLVLLQPDVYTRLMMCSIHIDESVTRGNRCTAVTSLCTFFSKKLNRLLDRLDNRHTMHGSRSDTLEWVRGSQKYADYYNGAMLSGL
jgi:hypothetical protein